MDLCNESKLYLSEEGTEFFIIGTSLLSDSQDQFLYLCNEIRNVKQIFY